MTLQELNDLKSRLDMGVMLHKSAWLEILDWAIEVTKHHEGWNDSDGWIPWNGGMCPVDEDQAVDVVFKDGYKAKTKAQFILWDVFGSDDAVVKYRIVK